MSAEVLVAVIAAGAAVLAATISAYYASKTKNAEFQAAQLLELEKRVAQSRAEVFEPLVDAWFRVWNVTASLEAPDEAAYQKAAGQDIARFNHWVQIYGSDESVRLAHQFMQAIHNDSPPTIALRLLAELILQARRELGYPETELNALDVLGIRVKDIYSNPSFQEALTLPLAELYARESWTPPWPAR